MNKNLIAGLTNSIWSALLGLMVIPYYLKYLGVEAYGLIGFFITMQAVLQILDMGIATTMNREVARCSAIGGLDNAGKLLHSLSVIYWTMGVFIAVLITICASWIADNWIQSVQLTSSTIKSSIILMGMIIACRWPIGLYQGAIIGAQRMAISSTLNIIMVTVGNIGAVALLAFISPTIEAFFIWQACVGLIYALAIRLLAWKIIGRKKSNHFDVDSIKAIFHFTFGMSGIILMGLIFSQMDKVLLSKILSLKDYAHYMLATVIASGLYVIVTPVYNIVYPRFCAIIASGEIEILCKAYRFYTRALAVVLFPTAMILAVFSNEIILVWTGDSDTANAVAPLVTLLVIGTALNGIMYVPHALQLAYGMTKLPLMINGILMIVFLPLIIYLAEKFGAFGGACAWALLHTFYVLVGSYLTHKYLLKGLALRWLVIDLGLPLFLSVLIGISTEYILQVKDYEVYLKLGISCGIGIFTVAISLFLSPQLLRFLYKKTIY